MNLTELRKKPHLSASGINEYLLCGMAFKYSRIDRIETKTISDSLVFGTAIHKALEDFYRAKMNGNTYPLDQLLSQFGTHWIEQTKGGKDINFRDGNTIQSLLEDGKALLETYYHQRPQDSFKVLGTEIPFSFVIEGVDVPLIGAIDVVLQDEQGNIIIVDHKTTNRAYSKNDIDSSQQLTLYFMAARRIGFRDHEILLRFDCLIKNKTPRFEEYYTVRSEEDELRTIKRIQKVWEGIQKEVFIPNDTTWKCGYCAYKTHCDNWFLEQAS